MSIDFAVVLCGVFWRVCGFFVCKRGVSFLLVSIISGMKFVFQFLRLCLESNHSRMLKAMFFFEGSGEAVKVCSFGAR